MQPGQEPAWPFLKSGSLPSSHAVLDISNSTGHSSIGFQRNEVPALNRRIALACSFALTMVVAFAGLAAATNAGWLGRATARGTNKPSLDPSEPGNEPQVPNVVAEYVLIDPPSPASPGTPPPAPTSAAGSRQIGSNNPAALRFAQSNPRAKSGNAQPAAQNASNPTATPRRSSSVSTATAPSSGLSDPPAPTSRPPATPTHAPVTPTPTATTFNPAAVPSTTPAATRTRVPPTATRSATMTPSEPEEDD